MRVVLDILRFREDYLPAEDRYEYSIVAILGEELVDIPVSEDQLSKALTEHSDQVGQPRAPVPPQRPQGPSESHPQAPVKAPYGMLGEPAEYPDVGLWKEGRTTLGFVAASEGVLEEQGGVEEGSEGGIVDAPHMFHSLEEEPHTYAQEVEEDPTLATQSVDSLVADLLDEPLDVDDLPSGGAASAFQEPPAPEIASEPRKDMTPGHTKRVESIRATIAERKKPNAHQQKLADMRARARRHPPRSGGGADEAGNPLVAPTPQPLSQAPAHVPGEPTVVQHKIVSPPSKDEDGFPSA